MFFSAREVLSFAQLIANGIAFTNTVYGCRFPVGLCKIGLFLPQLLFYNAWWQQWKAVVKIGM